jgi:hypothetical protein
MPWKSVVMLEHYEHFPSFDTSYAKLLHQPIALVRGAALVLEMFLVPVIRP